MLVFVCAGMGFVYIGNISYMIFYMFSVNDSIQQAEPYDSTDHVG